MSIDFSFDREKDEEAKVGKHTWYGKEAQTENESIHDTGKGDKIIIRLFEFKLRPDLAKLPTKEEILTPQYLKFLNNTLWGDGLRIVLTPRVHIDKEYCRVFVPCQAATGQTVLEEAKLLQEWI